MIFIASLVLLFLLGASVGATASLLSSRWVLGLFFIAVIFTRGPNSFLIPLLMIFYTITLWRDMGIDKGSGLGLVFIVGFTILTMYMTLRNGAIAFVTSLNDQHSAKIQQQHIEFKSDSQKKITPTPITPTKVSPSMGATTGLPNKPK